MLAPTSLALAGALVVTTVSAPPSPTTPIEEGVQGPEKAPVPAVMLPQDGIDPAHFDRRRRSAVASLVAAGLANALGFGLRGLNYWLINNRCSAAPGVDDGSLPEDTKCPPLLAVRYLRNAHRLPNAGLFALTAYGSRRLGRLRADRVRYGLATPFRASRRMEVLTPIAYFSAISVLSLGFLIAYDNATTPIGNEFLEAPTNQPAFNPLFQFGIQTMMTATAVSLGYYLHARAYSNRADNLELTPLGSVVPGGATFGLGGRF